MAESERELFNRLVRAHDLDVVWQDGPILSVAVGPPERGKGTWIVLVEGELAVQEHTVVEWWELPRRRLLQQGGFRGQSMWLWRLLGCEEPLHGDLVIQCTVGGSLARGLTISAAADRGQIEKSAVPSFFAPSTSSTPSGGGADA